MHVDAVFILGLASLVGVLLLSAADRLRLPPIAVLLAGGVVVGPHALGLIDPRHLGAALEDVVALAVAVILFEGGLTLDLAGYRRAPVVIVRMITLGAAITWVGFGVSVHVLFGSPPVLAALAGALVVVTGPTVIGPLLRRVGVQPRVHHVLYWEGVLIDAVGVLLATLCFEWLTTAGPAPGAAALLRFALRILGGASLGGAVGLAAGAVLRRGWIPLEHANIFALAVAIAVMGGANAMLHESGVLAVIVAGFVLGLRQPPRLRRLKRFKLQLTELGIAVVFVLLAARLDLGAFAREGSRLLWLAVAAMFVLRPLGVWLSTAGQQFTTRERVFMAWVAPRGIVAASMASLFALRLADRHVEGAELLELTTYSVVVGTVVVQGLSAPWLARVLGLLARRPSGWLLAGDPPLAASCAHALEQAGVRAVVLADTPAARAEARRVGASIAEGDPLDPDSLSDADLEGVGAMLAATSDERFNALLCRLWGAVFGARSCYRWQRVGDALRADAPGLLDGIPVWSHIPSLAEVAERIESGSFAVRCVVAGTPPLRERFGEGLWPLFDVGNADALPVSFRAGWRPEGPAVIALVRRIPGIDKLIDEVCVLRNTSELRAVVEALLRLAGRRRPELPVSALLDNILQRERAMPTTVGHGVAIPHAYADAVERSVVYLAVLPDGLDVSEVPDAEPLRVVALLLSPPNRAQEHLQALASVAQMATDESLLELVTALGSPRDIRTVLAERS